MAAYLGEFEQIVLLAVVRLGDEAYGVPIRREIAERAGRQVTVGALYATLDRLEAKGLVHSWFADPTPERGGRSKRYFRLLPVSLVLLIAAGLLLRALLRTSQIDPGFATDCRIYVRLFTPEADFTPEASTLLFTRLLDRARSLPS